MSNTTLEQHLTQIRERAEILRVTADHAGQLNDAKRQELREVADDVEFLLDLAESWRVQTAARVSHELRQEHPQQLGDDQ